MEFKNKKYIQKIYNNLKYGDRIEIKRDLSYGKLKEDMIQTIGLQVLPENKKYLLNLLYKYPIISIEVDKEDRFIY